MHSDDDNEISRARPLARKSVKESPAAVRLRPSAPSLPHACTHGAHVVALNLLPIHSHAVLPYPRGNNARDECTSAMGRARARCIDAPLPTIHRPTRRVGDVPLMRLNRSFASSAAIDIPSRRRGREAHPRGQTSGRRERSTASIAPSGP